MCRSQDCQGEVPNAIGDNSLCLQHYVAETTQRLGDARDSFRSGFGVDPEEFEWLLAQVDIVVDMIGDESLDLGDEQRTKILDLLLGIANLNEYIRRATVTSR
jgi:hypothetical protein